MPVQEANLKQKYLSKIGSEISNIDQVELSTNLQILNLHCNKITKIAGLDNVPFLQSLDLSGNQIKQISGLSHLNHLKHLNLACNLITRIENLSSLRSLKTLNISYNDINVVGGLKVFSVEGYSLQCLLLHGNQIHGINHFVSFIQDIKTIRTLTLSYDGVSNPICLEDGYRQKLLKIKHLENLDGDSACGTKLHISDDYIDAIFSSDDTNMEETISTVSSISEIPSYECSRVLDNEPCRESQFDIPSSPPKNVACMKEDKTKKSKIPVSSRKEKNEPTKTKIQNVEAKEIEFDQPDDKAEDQRKRDLIAGCYKALSNDLERERQRRLEAEKSNSELGNILTLLKTKMAKISKQLEKQSSSNAELQKIINVQKNENNEITEKYISEKKKVEQKSIKIEEMINGRENYKESIATLEHTLMIKEAEIARESAHHMKAENEKNIEAKASRHQMELVSSNNEKLKKQIKTLHSVIANREQEFQKEKEGLFSIDSKDFRMAIETEINSLKSNHSREIAEKDGRIKDLVSFIEKQKEDYCKNMDNECQQFQELQKAFETKCYENAQFEKNINDLKNKEEQSISLISELSAVVKEQQRRHLESTSKIHHLTDDLKKVGEDYENIRQKLNQSNILNENLKKSKMVLDKKLNGLGEIIEGLRAEKSLWSKELVNQGAMLSQNKGRIEFKLEILQKELKNSKLQEEKLNDGIKIKTKMLEDQTEVIRHLKVGITEKDDEIKMLNAEIISLNRESESFSNELEDYKINFEKLEERKEDLKLKNRELSEELEYLNESYNEICEKWNQQVGKIEELENNFCAAQNLWSEKERKIKSERDRAISAAELAIKKSQETEQACSDQCELQKQQIDHFLKKAEESKKQEIQQIKVKNCELHREIADLMNNFSFAKKNLNIKLQELDSFL